MNNQMCHTFLTFRNIENKEEKVHRFEREREKREKERDRATKNKLNLNQYIPLSLVK